MRKVAMLVLLVLVMMVGAAAVSAEENPTVPIIGDGRVNAWEIDAPVAIYCEFDYPFEDDTEMGVLSSIELYAPNGENNPWESILSVNGEAVLDAIDSDHTVLGEASGYGLIADGGRLTAYAPADSQGRPYTFTWELGDMHC